MQSPDSRFDIGSEAALARLFEAPREASLVKEFDHVDANYAAWIAASPFFVLCTAGVWGVAPKLVLVVTVEAAYYQCSRAVVRSDLWNAERHVVRGSLPTPGKVLHDATAGRIDGGAYDRELPARVKSTLY